MPRSLHQAFTRSASSPIEYITDSMSVYISMTVSLSITLSRLLIRALRISDACLGLRLQISDLWTDHSTEKIEEPTRLERFHSDMRGPPTIISLEMAAQTRPFDFLVLGSGIAGLSFALKVAPHGRVAILTKKDRAESNTNYAQGGIAAVTSKEDSIEMHVRDTLEAGAGLCKEPVVRAIIEQGPARVAELIQLGMRFSEREVAPPGARGLDLGKEGGHSKRRILHAKDVTGREIERALLAAVAAQPRIQIFENHIAIDLITSQKLGAGGPNRCLGVYVLEKSTSEVHTFAAPNVLLATGGCGKVYLYTTNPDIATGDGVAMAYRAGAAISNMEFIQFHPTCLYHPKAKSFLISEAVRG